MDATGAKTSVTKLSCHKVEGMMKELTEHGIVERNMEEETDEERSARVVAQGSTLFGGNFS